MLTKDEFEQLKQKVIGSHNKENNEKKNNSAYDGLYLYEWGAKDCVALLKKLGVL